MIAMALCEVGSICERRTAVLIDPKMSDLPPFLTEDSGVNSGLMIPQVDRCRIGQREPQPAYPASVDSIPTSAGQEDHVSMAPIAARKAGRSRATAGVVAVELIAAAQGIDYHAPLKTSTKLQAVHARRSRALAASRVATVTGPTRWPRFRRRYWPGKSARKIAAQLTRVQRCSLHSSIPGERAAAHVDRVRPDLADRRRARMLRLGSNAWPLNGPSPRAARPTGFASQPDAGLPPLRAIRLGLFATRRPPSRKKRCRRRDAHDDAALGVLPMALRSMPAPMPSRNSRGERDECDSCRKSSS
jgi:hypothetical protein